MTKLNKHQDAPNCFTVNFDIRLLKQLQEMYIYELWPVVSSKKNGIILSGGHERSKCPCII